MMGACAKAAHAAGGRVLGVIPHFLTSHERPLKMVDTVVVNSMHERKMMMFEEADAFAVLPGGIGTLEEVIELLSWRRLGLHAKPIVFLNLGGFWTPLFELLEHIVEQALDGLPEGPVMAKVPKIIKPPVAEVYHAIEAPKGEIGVYLVSDGTQKPYRMRIRPPSYINLQALRRLAIGHLVADVVALIGTMDIVLGEVDR